MKKYYQYQENLCLSQLLQYNSHKGNKQRKVLFIALSPESLRDYLKELWENQHSIIIFTKDLDSTENQRLIVRNFIIVFSVDEIFHFSSLNDIVRQYKEKFKSLGRSCVELMIPRRLLKDKNKYQ